jgi:hypothetical protein
MNAKEFDNKISKCNEASYLALSSCLFLYPLYVGFSCHAYNYSIPLLFSWMASVNYWRYPRYTWRRDADIFFSRITAIIFSGSSFFVVKNPYYIFIGYPIMAFFYYLFYLSTLKFEQGCPHWWKYHMCFHFLCALNQFMLLDDVCVSKYRSENMIQ